MSDPAMEGSDETWTGHNDQEDRARPANALDDARAEPSARSHRHDGL
jgi:hypothetical protein